MFFWRRRERGRGKEEKEQDVQNEESTIEESSTAAGAGSQSHETKVTAPQAASEASEATGIRDRIIAVLKTVYDPEIPVDIYELGLIYGVDVGEEGDVHVTMTLTSPMCPVAETLPPEVEDKIRHVVGVKEVDLDLVWDPPWSMDMMSDAARLELNLM